MGPLGELFSEGYLDKRFNDDNPLIRGYIFTITLMPKAEGKNRDLLCKRRSRASDGSYRNRQEFLLYGSGEWDLLQSQQTRKCG